MTRRKDMEYILADYKAGVPMQKISEKYHVQRATITRNAVWRGIPLRYAVENGVRLRGTKLDYKQLAVRAAKIQRLMVLRHGKIF